MNKLKSFMLMIALAGIFFVPGILVARGIEGIPSQSEPSAGMVAVDLVLVRPLSAVGSLCSTAVSIITMPIAYLCGVGEQSARVLVEAPWRFTTGRPLGEFDTYRDGRPIGHVER